MSLSIPVQRVLVASSKEQLCRYELRGATSTARRGVPTNAEFLPSKAIRNRVESHSHRRVVSRRFERGLHCGISVKLFDWKEVGKRFSFSVLVVRIFCELSEVSTYTGLPCVLCCAVLARDSGPIRPGANWIPVAEAGTTRTEKWISLRIWE